MKAKTVLIAVAMLTVLGGMTVANMNGQQRRGSRPLPSAVQLTEAEENHILYMREEEKLARDVYLTLYELWGAEIFANISESEQQHMDAYLSGLEEADLAAQLTIKRWDGVEIDMIRWHMLSHLLMHSMQHRSEAAVLLTQYGRSPGDIDFLFFTFAS